MAQVYRGFLQQPAHTLDADIHTNFLMETDHNWTELVTREQRTWELMCAKFSESRIGYSRWVHYYWMHMWLWVSVCVCVSVCVEERNCQCTCVYFVHISGTVTVSIDVSICMRVCVFCVRLSKLISLFPSVYWQILDRPQWAALTSLSHAVIGRYRSQDMHGLHTQATASHRDI